MSIIAPLIHHDMEQQYWLISFTLGLSQSCMFWFARAVKQSRMLYLIQESIVRYQHVHVCIQWCNTCCIESVELWWLWDSSTLSSCCFQEHLLLKSIVMQSWKFWKMTTSWRNLTLTSTELVFFLISSHYDWLRCSSKSRLNGKCYFEFTYIIMSDAPDLKFFVTFVLLILLVKLVHVGSEECCSVLYSGLAQHSFFKVIF